MYDVFLMQMSNGAEDVYFMAIILAQCGLSGIVKMLSLQYTEGTVSQLKCLHLVVMPF